MRARSRRRALASAAAAGFVVLGASPAVAERTEGPEAERTEVLEAERTQDLEAERTVTSLVPSDLQVSGSVQYYDVAETAVLTGDVEAEETAEYRCVQDDEAVRCLGEAVATGTVLGHEGTLRTSVAVTCDARDPAFPCTAWGVVEGEDGLAGFRATATGSGESGRATVVLADVIPPDAH